MSWDDEKVGKLKEEINILKHKSEQYAELESRIEQYRQEMVRGQKQIELRNFYL